MLLPADTSRRRRQPGGRGNTVRMVSGHSRHEALLVAWRVDTQAAHLTQAARRWFAKNLLRTLRAVNVVAHARDDQSADTCTALHAVLKEELGKNGPKVAWACFETTWGINTIDCPQPTLCLLEQASRPPRSRPSSAYSARGEHRAPRHASPVLPHGGNVHTNS
eukprot:TRINITY_DN12154_c0_g1_i1.p1 TRINITY_DN12154_c0_g1~~TRINITY_DN12154_c0_g1_i1.p1  ORF type:complete len:164 (-),score=12.75 TRINITY_DN12154_c0_g1_i1:634-1125(-)